MVDTNVIIRNGNEISFAIREGNANSGDILPGHHLDVTGETVDVGTGGSATFADINEYNPDQGRDDTYPDGDRVRYFVAPIGFEFVARVEAGSSTGDELQEGAAGELTAGATAGGTYRCLTDESNGTAEVVRIL